MALDRSHFNLFGLDLLQLHEHWRQGWREALQWPLFARLLPEQPVRLLLPGGRDGVWPPTATAAAARTLAVVLPDALVLHQRLHLPLLAAAEQRQALELAVQTASPFAAEATLWGWRVAAAGKGLAIDIALAARPHVADYLAQTLDDGAAVEVWTGTGPYVVLRGFAEGQRLARQRRSRWHTAALLGAAALLLLALAASPVVHKQQQLAEARTRLDALSREVAPVVASRDALGKAQLQLQAVAAYIGERPDPGIALGKLTALLPDSVHLTRLEARGPIVTISGLADNAAGLMDTLGARTDFHDVRAPSPITRDRASGRETFSIEFRLADGAAAP